VRCALWKKGEKKEVNNRICAKKEKKKVLDNSKGLFLVWQRCPMRKKTGGQGEKKFLRASSTAGRKGEPRNSLFSQMRGELRFSTKEEKKGANALHRRFKRQPLF